MVEELILKPKISMLVCINGSFKGQSTVKKKKKSTSTIASVNKLCS